MPVPEEHLAVLHERLEVHVRRVESVRNSIAQLEDEIAVHETLLSLGQDERVIKALSEIADRPESLNSADDCDALFRERGITFPPETRLFVQHGEGDRTVVSGLFSQGLMHYAVTWDSLDGFSLAPGRVPTDGGQESR